MGVQKKKLVLLLGVEVALIVVHNVLDSGVTPDQDWWKTAGWHYWLALGFGVFIFAYIFFAKCRNCGKPQIYRGMHPSQWSWPGDICWYCGAKIVEKK